MRTVLVMVLSVLFSSPAVSGQAQAQTPAGDSRTLQAILEEVRKLRQDLQTTSVTLERMQILLYRVRNQMDVVMRVTQRLEEAHTQATQAKFQRSQIASQVKQQEEALGSAQDSANRKEMENAVARLKEWMEKMADTENEATIKEAESTNELRLEQAKLAELQDQLDRLDKKLDNAFPRQ
jgi:chromosome segregation ATPase